MKNIKFLLALFFMILMANFQSTAFVNSPDAGGRIIITRTRDGGTLRPGMPSQQQVSVYYDDGDLYFTFAVDEGLAELCIQTEDPLDYQYFVLDTSIEEIVHVGTAPGHYSIGIVMGDGSYYKGEFYL